MINNDFEGNPSRLSRLFSKPKKRQIFGFDVETFGKYNRLYVGVIYGEDRKNPDKELIFRFSDTKDFLHQIKDNYRYFRGCYLVATNLQFDFNVLFNNIDNQMLKKFRFIYSNSSLLFAYTYMKYSDKKPKLYHSIPNKISRSQKKDYFKITFIDSMKFFACGVEKLGKMVGIPKMNIDIEKEDNELHAWKKVEDKAKLELLKEYNKIDAKITYSAMKMLQNDLNSLGGELKLTAASSSLDLYRRKYMPKAIYQNDRESILFMYKGYYGGRVECLKRGYFDEKNFGRIFVSDYNSLYPSCMLNKFPYPTGEEKVNRHVSMDNIMYDEGLVHVLMQSPEGLYFPLVPVRKDRLLFPLGIFDTYIDFATLRKALQIGYKIIKLYEGIVFKQSFYPFKRYIETLYDLRVKAKHENNPMQNTLKLLMNSLYGKFGFRYDNKKSIIFEEDFVKKILKFKDDDPKMQELMIEFEKNMFAEGISELTSGVDAKIQKYVIPILSIYTTAYGRIKLFDAVMPIINDVIYMDTDSIFTNNMIPNSEKLGELKFEESLKGLICITGKCYQKIYDDDTTVSKIKGISKCNDEIFKKLIYGGSHKYIKLAKTKEAARRGMYGNQLFQAIKTITGKDSKRIWQKELSFDDWSDSKPLILSE